MCEWKFFVYSFIFKLNKLKFVDTKIVSVIIIGLIREKMFFTICFFVLAPRTSLAGLPSRVTALPYANYKTKSEQLHSCRLILLYYYYL